MNLEDNIQTDFEIIDPEHHQTTALKEIANSLDGNFNMLFQPFKGLGWTNERMCRIILNAAKEADRHDIKEVTYVNSIVRSSVLKERLKTPSISKAEWDSLKVAVEKHMDGKPDFVKEEFRALFISANLRAERAGKERTAVKNALHDKEMCSCYAQVPEDCPIGKKVL